MSDEPTRNPRGFNPSLDSSLNELSYGQPANSLIDSLGDTVDDLRQIYTDFGSRPYKIHCVRISWSGGEVGRGSPTVIFDQPLLPTPKIVSLDIAIPNKPGGEVERGVFRLEEISPRYTEDEIKYYFSLDLNPAEEGFIEVRMDERDGVTERKRYSVDNVPFRRATKFDWTVKLSKEDQNRQRDGSVRPLRPRVR